MNIHKIARMKSKKIYIKEKKKKIYHLYIVYKLLLNAIHSTLWLSTHSTHLYTHIYTATTATTKTTIHLAHFVYVLLGIYLFGILSMLCSPSFWPAFSQTFFFFSILAIQSIPVSDASPCIGRFKIYSFQNTCDERLRFNQHAEQ